MSERMITFLLNGVNQTVKVTGATFLLDLLREELGLTGTKRGCGNGECGACTVLVDGLPIASCIYPAVKADGKTVATVEGLGSFKNLHPLQTWFLKLGAVQCGFCTPGLLMSAKGLLDRNSNPSTEEVRQAIAGNLCRCTGYKKVVEAILAAAADLKGVKPIGREDSQIERVLGRSLVRVDGVPKVMGMAQYTEDLKRPGMLHGTMLVSPHSHARILSIDSSRALLVQGVVAVLTSKDVPGPNHFGIVVKDQPFLAVDKVRYIGDPVAVVIAHDKHTASLGAKEIHVDYEVLPAIFDPRKAMEKDAVQIHTRGNILIHRKIRMGNIGDGFNRADIIARRKCTTPMVEHAYIEPEAALAYWEGEMLTIQCPTQAPHYNRFEIARMLNLPVSRVRVIQAATGGGFGGKVELLLQHLVALGTYVTGRPVKMVLTREESFLTSTKRHAFFMDTVMGATKDGRLTAAKVEIIGDTGAYASLGPPVITRTITLAIGPYECPNVHVDSYCVYTNKQIQGAMRGFGTPQVATCHEPLLDEIGRRCGLSPVAIRRVNMLRPGSVTLTQQVLETSVGALETLERVAKRWEGMG
jgi:CO/xanthine dehydrogenase Mo-binding subunit/aerobic-type carbon monoxide dehydrogenase small subunit (CoxS/CutS family)